MLKDVKYIFYNVHFTYSNINVNLIVKMGLPTKAQAEPFHWLVVPASASHSLPVLTNLLHSGLGVCNLAPLTGDRRYHSAERQVTASFSKSQRQILTGKITIYWLIC